MRFEIHPADGAHPDDGYEDQGWYWHRRAGNGQITSNGETYTRDDDAVRAIRTDIEDVAELLGISPEAFDRLYAPELTYHKVTGYTDDADPVYEERPLYPTDGDEPTSARRRWNEAVS